MGLLYGAAAPSPTVAITDMAMNMRRWVVISSALAREPDFDTPQHIKCTIDAMRLGKTKYTQVDGIGIKEAESSPVK